MECEGRRWKGESSDESRRWVDVDRKPLLVQVEDHVLADDLKTLIGSASPTSNFVLHSFNTGKSQLVDLALSNDDDDLSSRWPINLSPLGFEIIVVSPFLNPPTAFHGIAALGLIDKFNSLAGVSGFTFHDTSDPPFASCKVKCSGTLGFFVWGLDEEQAKTRVAIITPGQEGQGMDLEFETKEADGDGTLVIVDLAGQRNVTSPLEVRIKVRAA